MSTRTSISISVRRHFVDDFFFCNAGLLISKTSKVIDIGGHKGAKRGLFDVEKFSNSVMYVNIDETKSDIAADASSIPESDSSYDVAIMGELLEHVPEPLTAVKEAYRLLKPDGILIATVPFMFPIHPDPFDYGRYTDMFWKKLAKDVGFSRVEIQQQGTAFAVAALMVQHLFLAKKVSWRPIQYPLVAFLMWLDKKTSAPLLKNWTTGFGLIFKK